MNENKIVGHLPKETSHATKFLLDKAANVTTNLSSTHYYRSPLLHGSLEIPWSITACIPASDKGDMFIGKYKEVESLYIESKNLLLAVSSKRMIMTKTKTWLGCQWSEERCLKKSEQREPLCKDATNDIGTFFKIAEKQGNY